MLTDITTITSKIFNIALSKEEPLMAPKLVYDVYRNLTKVIDDANCVANHYLALDFSEEYLQNSSFGEPVDKWRRFFNEDLERLNRSTKKYLNGLSNLTHDGMWSAYMSNYYRHKTFYGFVRDHYSVGYVETCGKIMYIIQLESEKFDSESVYIKKLKQIDLSTFEMRKALQTHIISEDEKLKREDLILRNYILNKYEFEDLL